MNTRPPNWAASISFPGVPNLWQVSPVLYRGAEPTWGGLGNLAAFGVKTVVNLESWNLWEWAAAKRFGLRYVRIPCLPLHPELEDVGWFLDVVTGPGTPVFVHCRQGADRTGMMCAFYRHVVQGWPMPDAVEEMVQGGYGWNGWPEIIPFINRNS
jgi:hypothetical protein